MVAPTRSSLRPRTLAGTSALAAAAVLSLGATAHAHEPGTDSSATIVNAASVHVFELDTSSSRVEGKTVESGSGSLQVHDGTATLSVEMRTATNNQEAFTRMFVEASNFVPPAPGESAQISVDRGGISDENPNGPGSGTGFLSVTVVNVDGTYELRAGGGTFAVFRAT